MGSKGAEGVLRLVLDTLMKVKQTDDGLLVIEHGEIDRGLDKMVVFDLDLTLIGKAESPFSASWEYLFPEVPERLRLLSRQGYFIGMASNQSQIEQLGVLDVFVEKVCSILADIGVPAVFLAALRKNKYRKPSPGMYEYMCKEYASKAGAGRRIYVGDATSCSLGPGHTNSCDSKFAYNGGMEFKHPDEFFKGTPVTYFDRHLDIESYRGMRFEAVGAKDIVFVFGRRRHCGKRFFAAKYFPLHRVVSSATLHNGLSRCMVINCTDRHFIEQVMREHPGRYSMYYLDYPEEVMGYLRTLAVLSGEESSECVAPDAEVLRIAEKHGVRVPFVFDDSGFGPEKMKLSRMQL